MAETKNYLLGRGERLTEKLDPPRTKPDKKDPYTFDTAKKRLAPRLSAVVEAVDALPLAACPHDETVAVVTLHPTYLAKSYFPSGLLNVVGLQAVGSRTQRVIPESGAKAPRKKKDERHAPQSVPAPTAELFVAGPRKNFQYWAAA